MLDIILESMLYQCLKTWTWHNGRYVFQHSGGWGTSIVSLKPLWATQQDPVAKNKTNNENLNSIWQILSGKSFSKWLRRFLKTRMVHKLQMLLIHSKLLTDIVGLQMKFRGTSTCPFWSKCLKPTTVESVSNDFECLNVKHGQLIPFSRKTSY